MAMIHVRLADGTETDVDEAQLVKSAGVIENDHEHIAWVEYRLPGDDRIVHRSAHVTLKELPGLFGDLAQFG